MKMLLFTLFLVLWSVVTPAQTIDMEKKSHIRQTMIDGQAIDVPPMDACCTSIDQTLLRKNEEVSTEIHSTDWYVFRYNDKEVLVYVDHPYLAWGVLSGHITLDFAKYTEKPIIAAGGWTGSSNTYRSTVMYHIHFMDESDKTYFCLQAMMPNGSDCKLFIGYVTDDVDKVAVFKKSQKKIEYLIDNGYNYGECTL